MIRYSQLYTHHHVTVLDFHPFTPGSRPRPWLGKVNCTHTIMLLYLIFIPSLPDQDPDYDQVQSTVAHTIRLLYLIFIPSLLDQDPDHDQVQLTVHSTSCYCTVFSSIHLWIKTQTMIRYSILYTLHHVTVLDFHPFTHGSRPRLWSGTVNCSTHHQVTVLDFHPLTPGSRPRPWSGTRWNPDDTGKC